VSAQIQVPAK